MIQSGGKMRDEKELLAKEIFMKYYGNHYQMDREGEYSYYKSYNISKKQEKKWIKECNKKLLPKIKKEDFVGTSFLVLSDIIQRSKDFDYLRLLLDEVEIKRDNCDTFSKLRMAEELYSIYETFVNIDNKTTKVLLKTKKLVLDILKEITFEPITIASYYKNLGYLNDLLTEEKIKNRIHRHLTDFEKF